MRNVYLLWIAISLAQLLSGSQCNETTNGSTNDVDKDIEEKLLRDIINCTRYIPADFLQIMYKHQSTLEIVPYDYQIACLQAELRHKNETPPFDLRKESTIKYNIALNELVSLGFDGTLITKARISREGLPFALCFNTCRYRILSIYEQYNALCVR